MAMSKSIKWGLGIVAALVVIAAAVLYPKLVVTLPKDGADAKTATFKDTYGGRSSPPALLNQIDVKEMAKKFGMLAAFKNGPRLWTLDWIEVEMRKELDFGEIATLGSRLKLPAGWKFRSVVLEQDLILTPDKTGTAHITQDDFGNTYDRVGGPYSNYKP